MREDIKQIASDIAQNPKAISVVVTANAVLKRDEVTIVRVDII